MQGAPKPSDFWAKLNYKNHDRSTGEIEAWHPLAAHCADVAAVTEALLSRTILRSRLARLIGWTNLTDVHIARLAALAAIHDSGKVNHGFQNQAFDADAPRVGHVTPMVEALSVDNPREYLIPLTIEPMVNWFDSGEETLANVLLATWGHHGRPVVPSGNFKHRLWHSNEHRDPIAGLKQLGNYVRRWFPKAFNNEARPFPSDPVLQHAFNGILTLADWIGSDNDRFFPFAETFNDPMPRARKRASRAIEALFLDSEPTRASLDADITFSSILDNPSWNPYPVQEIVRTLPLHEEGSLTILESDTGSGKTETAIARFIRLFQAGLVDGMYFALPTRSAATQLHKRAAKIVERIFPEKKCRPPVILAVPGYLKVDAKKGKYLPPYRVLWDDDPKSAWRERGWAAEHPKRYLSGPIVVGTIDQVLLSSLQVKHAHMRAASLLRHFLVVDEVHASDTYMTRLLDQVLDQHLAAGSHILLMSATLGTSARIRFTTKSDATPLPLEKAENEPYPLVTHVGAERRNPTHHPSTSSGHSKTVKPRLKPIAGDPSAVAKLAAEKARGGARVLVIRNRVADCVATQQALEKIVENDPTRLLQINGIAAPHHSRFAPDDRKRLDSAIEKVLGRDSRRNGVVAVATQTVEQSLDIDADLLITDLCPIDVLLQRIGRLHRHDDRSRPEGFETAHCFVLTPEHRDLGPAIIGDGRALKGKNGLGTVYQDLRALEATWRILEDKTRDVWHIPKDNRPLVERGTHPERLQGIVSELGDSWKKHQEYLFGKDMADRQLPDLVGIDVHAPFRDSAFPDDLKSVKTRLGRDDYHVDLPEAIPGPFGKPIKELSLTEWQVKHMPEELIAESVEAFEGGFRFVFGDSLFQYDRFGLMPVKN